MLTLTINNEDKHSQFLNYLDITKRKPNLRKGNNWQSVVKNNPAVFKTAPLSEFLVEHPDIYQVNDWDLLSISKVNKIDESMHYDMQIIFQCENDPIVNRAAVRLAGKHPRNSIVIQLDANSHYRAFIMNENPYSGWHQLSEQEWIKRLKAIGGKGNLRWQVVGHGRMNDEHDGHHQTLAGQSAKKLAENLSAFTHNLKIEHRISIKPSQVSLVGCSMSSDDRNNSFAHDFMFKLHKFSIKTNVSAAITALEVGSGGHKLKAYIEDNNLSGNQTEQLYWNHWGEITTVRKENMQKRLKNIIGIIDSLVSGHLAITELSNKQRRQLAEWFPQSTNKNINTNELLLTLHDPMRIQSLNESLKFIHKIARNDFFDDISIISALGKIKDRSDKVLKSIKHLSNLSVDIDYHVQSLYFSNSNNMMRKLAQTYIYFYSQKQGKLFLDALSIDSDIYNRQQESIASVTELDDMHRFRQLLNDLKETDSPPFFQENLSELPVESYQLSHENYHFAIIVKNDDSGINKIIFYDPNIGTITNISHDRVRDYLIDNYSLPKERALRLSIMDNPSNTHQFLSLQHFLQLGFNTEYQRIKNIDINSFGLTIKAALLYKAGLSFEGKPIVDAGEFSRSNPIISQLKINPVAFDLFMATASDVDAMIVAQWLQRYMRLYADPTDILLGITEGINVTENKNLRLTTEHKLTEIKNHDFKSNSKTHILSLLKKPSSFYGAFGRMGYAMQGYGLISAFRLVADYKRRLNSGELNTEQNREMQQQLALVWGGVGANIAINALQFAFRTWGIRYLQKIIGNGAVMTPALLSRITLLKHHPTLLLNSHFLKDLRQLAIRQTASGIARFTLPILSVITSGIDIYQAYYAFSRLANETDPHIRRDLMASGIFSTINAAIGLGVAISMAVGGTVGIMAGPVGIILAATMMVAGEIFSAVSQIERIRDIVPDMTGGQRFENGLRLFLKFPLAPGVDNQIRYNQTLSHIQQQQHDYYQELLGRSVGVDTLFYSRGDIILQSIPFIKRDDRSQFVQITEKVRAFLGDPLENARIYTEYAERGQHEYYQLDNINSVNDAIIADNTTHESNASVVKIEKLNIYHNLSELSGESVKGDFILHGDVDHNGVNDFIIIYGKCHTYFSSTKNSLGFSSLEDYIDSWYYEIDFFLANTDGGYSKINQVLPSEQLPMAILEKEFSNMAFPLLGDFNGDGVPELIIFSHNGMTVYNYDSVLFTPTEGVNGFTSHSGGFINPIKQSLYEGNSLDYPYSLVGDINRDGFDDVLLFNKQGEMLQLSGNSSHEFNQSKISLPTELHDLLSSLTPHRSQLQLADLNKDGFLDLIVILDDGTYYRLWGKKVAESYTFDTPVMINKITFREEEGNRVRYRQNRLAKIGQNKIISLSQNEQGGHNLLSLSKQGEIHAHPLSEVKENDVAALYDLGGGHDIAEGYSKKRNIFTVGEGVKEYKGGENADTFILTKFIGTNIHILNGDRGNDTVTLGETLDKNVHSVIDINTRYYSQVSHDSEKRVALLYNFENVIGHESVNDKIMGTDGNNYLNGMGAEDEIHAYAGNDVLALEAGVANGGQGLDNYHILKNSRDYPVKIRIEEEQENDSEKLPTSNILLDHKLNEIISIELEQLDILIKLRSGDGYITEIRLIGIYETQDNYKQQVLSFNIQTADGFTLTPLWPTFFNEESEFSPKMVAYYLPLTDRGYKHLLGKNSPESMVVQLSLGLHQQQHVVTHISQIEGEKDKILRQCILPDFVTLSPREHSLLIGFLPHYELLGDQHDNIFQALKGQGLLTGYGGNDTYFIQEEMDNPTEIRIDNHDNSLATDTLLLASWLLSDIIIEADGDDVLLHHREQSEKHQRIRLLNYMADESYRHLIITDKSGQSQYRDSTVGEFVYYRVDIDSENRPFIAAQQMPAVSAGNDEVVIHAATFLPENSIDSGDGNDALIYIRGRENTTLKGGAGDDTYYYSAGSGVINIEESSGEDQLYLDKTIGLHTLSAERRENNLILNLQDDALNRITFIDWYLGQGKQLEFIWVEDSQITFDELFSVRPYSNEYYQLCQELNSMGLTLSVRQLADIDSSDGYNTLSQLNTIKTWAVNYRINRPVDMDYLVSLATVAWQYYSREADPLPLIREKINQVCQPLIAEHISLTVEQFARLNRDNLSTRTLADKVSQYHLRRPEDIDYLLDQLDSINRSPLDDRAVDFALKNRIDLTQPDIEFCWQEYGFSREILIQWAIRYSINSRGKFNLMLSNIQVLKEFGVVFSEGQPPLALNKSLNLRHYFHQKKLTAEHIAQLSEQDMTFDQLILRLDRGMAIEQAFIAEPQPVTNPEPLLTPELIDESGLSIGSLTEAMGAMDSVEIYPEFIAPHWMPQPAVAHSPPMRSVGIN
nr:C80 family cysteine peptidase [Yersinia mollaretii]